MNVELPYGSKRHARVLKELCTRRDYAERHMTEYYSELAQAEDDANFYIKETEGDALRRVARDAGRPQYTTIVVPYSYALMLTAHSYFVSVFLGRNPVHQFSGRNSDGQQGVLPLEAIIDYQVRVGRHVAPYIIWLLDACKYGIGILGVDWREDRGKAVSYEEVEETIFGIPTGRKKKVKVVEETVNFLGNGVFNIRPQDAYPDPRVALSDYQSGEFFGHRIELLWHQFLAGVESGKYINEEVMRKLYLGGVRKRRDESSLRLPDTTDAYVASKKALAPFEGFQMEVEIIPREWGLDGSTELERWVFTVIADEVVIQARPCGALHGKFHYCVLEVDLEGYGFKKRGLMEIGKPLNHTMTWLLNSHFHNVRKTLNNEFIVDTGLINVADLKNPNPGRFIRAKAFAMGARLSDAIQQLTTVDVTRTHISDMQLIATFMQQLLGVSDWFTGGPPTRSSRRTATEVRTNSTGSMTRMQTAALYQSSLGWELLAQILVQNTQQYMDEELQLRVAGDAVGAEQFIRVSPEDIAGFFDYVPADPSAPPDKFAMANLWREFLKDIIAVPGLAQGWDLNKIVSYVMQLAGAKNVNQFRIQVMDDEDVIRQAMMGNLEPIGGRGGGNTGVQSAGNLQPGRAVSVEEGAGEPGQIPGMGSTG